VAANQRQAAQRIEAMNDCDWSHEETDNPLLADERNFHKVDEWTKDRAKIDRLLYACNNLEKAVGARSPARSALTGHIPLKRIFTTLIQLGNLVAIEAIFSDLHPSTKCPD
jgi:hypothetical protein